MHDGSIRGFEAAIHVCSGDVRRISDLFGLSVEGATRYLATIEHADLTGDER